MTLAGRVILPYSGYDKHVALLSRGTKIGAAKLWYDKPKQRFYLLVSLEVEVAEPTPHNYTRIVGVDVGQRYLAVTATLENGASFSSGKQVRAKADHYARLRKRLQHTRRACARQSGGREACAPDNAGRCQHSSKAPAPRRDGSS